MKFIIMTGMSGSGKTVALKALEDYGYYCVDNIPVQLITGFADLLADSKKYLKLWMRRIRIMR